MSVTAIAFTMYPVADTTRAVAFYRDVVGLTLGGIESPNWVEFDIAGATFGVGNFAQVGTPGSGQSLALEVGDLTAYRKLLADKGVETSEPHETPVCWISVVRDPDGNQIWLHQAKRS